ncbi:hypothetical protein ACVW16_001293 [Bradyrhizobium sp. USDA 4474]
MCSDKGNWIDRLPGVARAPLLSFSLGPGCAREGDGINWSGCERGCSHWRPGRSAGRAEQAGARSQARRWFAVPSVAAAMVGASLIGWHFHPELVADVTRYIGEQDNVGPAQQVGRPSSKKHRSQAKTRRKPIHRRGIWLFISKPTGRSHRHSTVLRRISKLRWQCSRKCNDLLKTSGAAQRR